MAAVSGCAERVVTVDQPFPSLTVPQVKAMRACVADQPVLWEWIVRFNKAEEAAIN